MKSEIKMENEKNRDDAESSTSDEDDTITVGGINLKVLSLTSNNKEETITTFSVKDRMAAWKGAAECSQADEPSVSVSRKIGNKDTWIKKKKGRKESSSTKKKQAAVDRNRKEELLAKFDSNSKNWISTHKSMTKITPITNTTDTEINKVGRREDLIAQFEANSLSWMNSTGR